MDETGKLRVRVYTGSAQLPVEGATVIVTRDGKSGKYELLTVQSTDSSGLIQPLEVAAPAPPHLGMPPDQLPCANCAVWAEHPGFITLRVEGVQIFSGVETVQNMDLVPLAERQYSLQRHSQLDIPSQNL